MLADRTYEGNHRPAAALQLDGSLVHVLGPREFDEVLPERTDGGHHRLLAVLQLNGSLVHVLCLREFDQALPDRTDEGQHRRSAVLQLSCTQPAQVSVDADPHRMGEPRKAIAPSCWGLEHLAPLHGVLTCAKHVSAPGNKMKCWVTALTKAIITPQLLCSSTAVSCAFSVHGSLMKYCPNAPTEAKIASQLCFSSTAVACTFSDRTEEGHHRHSAVLQLGCTQPAEVSADATRAMPL